MGSRDDQLTAMWYGRHFTATVQDREATRAVIEKLPSVAWQASAKEAIAKGRPMYAPRYDEVGTLQLDGLRQLINEPKEKQIQLMQMHVWEAAWGGHAQDEGEKHALGVMAAGVEQEDLGRWKAEWAKALGGAHCVDEVMAAWLLGYDTG